MKEINFSRNYMQFFNITNFIRVRKCKFPKRELYEILQNYVTGHVNSKNVPIDYVLHKYNLQHYSSVMLDQIKQLILSSIIHSNRRWRNCRCFKERLLKKLRKLVHRTQGFRVTE